MTKNEEVLKEIMIHVLACEYKEHPSAYDTHCTRPEHASEILKYYGVNLVENVPADVKNFPHTKVGPSA